MHALTTERDQITIGSCDDGCVELIVRAQGSENIYEHWFLDNSEARALAQAIEEAAIMAHRLTQSGKAAPPR